jgi:hypothetical protein
MDGRGSIPGADRDIFSLHHRVQTGSGAPSPVQWVPGAKRSGREAYHSPPLNSKVRLRGAVPPLPQTSSWRGA